MNNNSYLFKAYFLFVMFAISACSANDETDLQSKTEERTFQAEVYAVKEGGDVTETRAMFFGGNSGTNYFCLWDSGDNAEVYFGNNKVGVFTPNSFGHSDSYLSGTLSGTYSVGNTLDLYVPKGDMDFTGQIGTLGDMSSMHTFMVATTSITEVNSSGQFVSMSNASFKHKQFFFRFRFSDTDNIRLPIEQLTIRTTGGKLVLTKSRDGSSVTYGDIVINTVKDQNAYPNEVFVALQNDYEGVDTYSFTVKSGGYIYESVDASTKLTKQYANGNFARVHRALPMKGSASRIQNGSEVSNFENGNGATGESGSVTF